MQYLLNLYAFVIFVILLILIGKSNFFYHRRVHPLLFQLMFIIKVIAGIGMAYIYSRFYTDRSTADIFKYFDDSGILMSALTNGHYSDFFKMFTGIDSGNHLLDDYYRAMISWDEKDALYNDSRIIIRLNVLLRFISFGNYYIHVLMMCFITMFGLTCLFHLFADVIKEKFNAIFMAVFCLPSVIFWNSGMLKDGLLITSIGVFLYHFNLIFNKKLSFFHWLILAVSFLLMLFLKTYVLVIMFPALILVFLIKKFEIKSANNFSVWLITYAIYFVLLFNAGKIAPQFDPVTMMMIKQQNFFQLARDMNAGSYFEINSIHSIKDVFIYAPVALFNVLFRPFIWENSSPLVVMSAIENIFIFIFAVMCLRFINKENLSDCWLKFCLIFVLLLFILIGLIVPVAGAIVRYKVTALPFLMIALIMITDKNKWNKLLSVFQIIK